MRNAEQPDDVPMLRPMAPPGLSLGAGVLHWHPPWVLFSSPSSISPPSSSSPRLYDSPGLSSPRRTRSFSAPFP